MKFLKELKLLEGCKGVELHRVVCPRDYMQVCQYTIYLNRVTHYINRKLISMGRYLE